MCLSLLGTWAGPSWTSASTLLQVLVSVQSLILVEDPFFNEPGYESLMGTAPGKIQSDRYNQRVRCDNVKAAMMDNIRCPPAHMATAVRTHFSLKRRFVKKTVVEWFPDCVNPEAAANVTSAAGSAAANALNALSTSTQLLNMPNFGNQLQAMQATLQGAYQQLAVNQAQQQRSAVVTYEQYLKLIVALDGLG